MTFVDTEYQVFALFNQNELHQVEPGNEAEITLDTYPGRIIKAHVDSVIWAQAQGQIDASGNLPDDHRRRAAGAVPGQAAWSPNTTTRCSWRPAPAAPPPSTPNTSAPSPDSQSADPDVVVPRLRDHQAPHQPPLKDGPWLALT